MRPSAFALAVLIYQLSACIAAAIPTSYLRNPDERLDQSVQVPVSSVYVKHPDSLEASKNEDDAWLGKFRSEASTHSFVGEVSSSEAFKGALSSCSHAQEIILLSSTADSLDAAAQTLWMLKSFGITHAILVTPSAADCKKAVSQVPDLGCCVWKDLDLPKNEVARSAFGNHRKLMHIRLRLAARALRLEYNVMFLDTDLIIFDHPYKYLKQPPFSDKQMVCSGTPLQPNIGIMYIQNAKPDGPVAWLFAETVDRALRWSEAPAFLASKTDPALRGGAGLSHATWDQSILSDAMLSGAIGRPLFANSFLIQDMGSHVGRNMTWFQMHMDLGSKYVTEAEHAASKGTEQVVRQASFPLQWSPLKVPASGGQWPAQFGGKCLPEVRGNLSQAWINLLREESGEPMWQDPYSSSPAKEHRVTESVAYLPNWFVASWWGVTTQRDKWDIRQSPPVNVIGHMLWMPNDKRVYKNALKMAYGW